MNAGERREMILEYLKREKLPTSASSFARLCGVSRQIIVGDIALLRAANIAVFATPRGYLLQQEQSAALSCTIACRHDRDGLADELYAVVDEGGGVLDVTVEHSLYGQISGQLQIFSRHDADMFLQKLDRDNAQPLSALTDGIHLHTIVCPDGDTRARILAALAQKGILFGG